MSSGPERKHLLIPIHVDALVVGGDGSDSDESPLKDGTVSAAPNYSRLESTYTFGIHLRQPTVRLGPKDKPTALESGVHLHFRLPAVAAHGDLKKDPAFPRIPNRWLVQRYYKTDRGLRTKAWLVRSDEMAGKPEDKKSAVVLLVDPPAGATGPFSFRPTGVAGVLWDEDKTIPKYDYRLDNKSADDVRLTAVTGGDAGFSAHYPACRSILGFYDDLDGVPDHPRPELSYLVTGWYSKTGDDPWSGFIAPLAKAADQALKEADGKKLEEAAKGKVLEEIRSQLDEWMKDRGCSVPKGSPIFPKSLALVKALPAGILCHGTVRNIFRKTEGRPFKEFKTPTNYWVDLGNTSAESFAARVARERISAQKSQNTGYVNLLEDLVTALQVGLLTQRVNAAEMDAELHQQGFAAVAGGKRWVIQQAVKEPPNKATASPPSVLPALPADLQEKLDKLNERERECERRERLLRDYRWELYALWYRWTDAKKGKYFKLTGELEQNLKVLEEFVDPDIKQGGKGRDDANTGFKSEVEKARKRRDTAKAELGGDLTQRSGKGPSPILYTLSEQPAAPFYAPKDPVLLVTGPAAKGLGTQGREPVKVRVTGEELRSFSYDLAQARNHSRKADELLEELKVSDKYLEAIPPWCVTLLKETLLLDEIDAEDSQALAKRKSRKSGKYVSTHTKAETDGVFPDIFGRFSWEHNPWIPLYLYWDVSWLADDWSAKLTDHWRLRESDGSGKHDEATSPATYVRNTELLPVGELTGKGKPFRFSGLSFVGHPLFDLQSERIDASKASLQKLINQVKESLGNRRSLMISQPLGGLHDALMMRRAGDQLSPLDYDLWNKEKKLYRHPIGRALGKDFYTDSSPATPVGAPPAKYPDFCPIRNGLLELKNLVIIDAFGQKTMIDPTGSGASGQSPDLSQSGRFVGGLPSPKNPLAVRLHPRFCRPLRLEFTGISAEAFGAGPVCGWVVFNRFDQNLVLYAASGQPVGILQKRFDESDLDPTGGTLFYWVAVPGARYDEATVDERTQSRHLQILENTKYIQNPHLKDFARFVLSLNFAAGGRFAELINTAAQATEERVPEDNPLISVLLGRPLALVRAELRLEMDGLPALDQKLSWREDPTSGAPLSLKQILADSLATGTSPTPNRFMITGGVEEVLCPVRLGDRRSANDGLVGFFKGQPPPQQDGNVYSLNDHPFYSSWGFGFGSPPYAGLRDSQDLELSCERALQVTLLMDPQARVHVTSGVLPRGFLELSTEQLKGAKQIREVFFQAAPVLGTPSTPHVPKPSDDYGQWSWVYRPDVTGWAEDPEMVSAAELAGPAVGWPTLTEGWLKLKTEPVLIRSLWMKAPVKKPRKGDLVTLAWSLHNVVSVELLQLHPDGTEKQLKTWTESPGYEWGSLKVEEDTTFRIRARNQTGFEDYKDIEIRTEKDPL